MSTLKVTVEKIEKIDLHPNADRLELAIILGWQCVVQKDRYKAGDKIVYIPIDSILPETLEADIFGKNSKVKLSKHRVKTIKLRGAISQGLVVDLKHGGAKDLSIGTDITKDLGVTKYEPPAPGFQGFSGGGKIRYSNPSFKKYTSIENIKNYPKLFDPEDEVIITEKIHGTNFRCGWVKYDANTIFKKLKRLFRLTPEYEFVYGSREVQLRVGGESIYADIVKQYRLKERLQYGEVIYGEIYGSSVQKNYQYGCKEGERELIVFDMVINGKYADHYTVICRAYNYDLKAVPVVFQGKFGEADLNKLVSGPSVLCSDQKIREGVVVRPEHEESSYAGRKILKAINPEYLLKDNTEFH